MSRFRHFLAASLATAALAALPPKREEPEEDAETRLIKLEARAAVHRSRMDELFTFLGSLRERCIDLDWGAQAIRERLDRLEALAKPPSPEASPGAEVIPFPQKPQEASCG